MTLIGRYRHARRSLSRPGRCDTGGPRCFPDHEPAPVEAAAPGSVLKVSKLDPAPVATLGWPFRDRDAARRRTRAAADIRTRNRPGAHPHRLHLLSTILGWGDLHDDAAVRAFVQTHPFIAFRPAATSPT